MKSKTVRVTLVVGVFLFVLVALAVPTQDKNTVKVPNGLGFSEFRGYENWQYVAPSVTADRMKIIGANPVMVAAYQAGIPANGKPFPDGAVLTKVQWLKKPSAEFPTEATVPGELKEVEFMVKDSKRFPENHGWGYAEFLYDAASGTYTPLGTGASCGAACHNGAAKKDYVFTEYAWR